MKTRHIGLLVGIVCVCIGILQFCRIPYFFYHSNAVGKSLLQQANEMVSQSNPDLSEQTIGTSPILSDDSNSSGQSTSRPKETTTAAQSTTLKVIGKIDIPSLSVMAPIVEGTDDSEINVAVGHLSTSVQPGKPGISILAAHNATWFRHIDLLKSGDQIEVTTTNGAYRFEVYDRKIEKVGYNVVNTQSPGIVLESCYPLDALYLTSYRYLVFGKLISNIKTGP